MENMFLILKEDINLDAIDEVKKFNPAFTIKKRYAYRIFTFDPR